MLFLFKQWAFVVSFSFISVLFKRVYNLRIVDLSRIQTWIIAVEGVHADHLTTTATTDSNDDTYNASNVTDLSQG